MVLNLLKVSTKAWLNLSLALLFLYSYEKTVQGGSLILSLLLTLDCENLISGSVILSPSEIVPVCGGDVLKFTCNITGTILEWNVPLIGSGHRFRYGISASDSAEAYNHQLMTTLP